MLTFAFGLGGSSRTGIRCKILMLINRHTAVGKKVFARFPFKICIISNHVWESWMPKGWLWVQICMIFLCLFYSAMGFGFGFEVCLFMALIYDVRMVIILWWFGYLSLQLLSVCFGSGGKILPAAENCHWGLKGLFWAPKERHSWFA